MKAKQDRKIVLHETLFRGQDELAKIRCAKITICGAGALGSNIADNLARQGAECLRVIDHDRVEEHNIGTQIYGLSDVGVQKVEALRSLLYRATQVELDPVAKKLTDKNAKKLLRDSDLVVDVFDNAASREAVRAFCSEAGIPCLHVGLYADYGEVLWNEDYVVPEDVAGDVCDYPLARNMVLASVTVATEAIVQFLTKGGRPAWTITLGDFSIRPMEQPVGSPKQRKAVVS